MAMDPRKIVSDSVRKLTSYEFQILDKMEKELEHRSNPTERNQQRDDNLFSDFNNYLYLSATNNHESRIKVMFSQVMDIVAKYEAKGYSIHKGSIFVNFAVVCLRTGDFINAMHFFHKTEFEERLLGNNKFDILHSSFFEKNYWDRIKAALLPQLSEPSISRFEIIYGTKPSGSDIDQLLRFQKPQFNLQMLGFLTRFVQLHNRELKNDDQTILHSTATAFYYLVGEIGALFESILRDKLGQPSQNFHTILENNLARTQIGNISAEFKKIHSDSNLKITQNGGLAEFNSHIIPLINEVFVETNRVRNLALCLYLLKSIRNNIIHDISISTPFYGESELLIKCFLAELVPFWLEKYL